MVRFVVVVASVLVLGCGAPAGTTTAAPAARPGRAVDTPPAKPPTDALDQAIAAHGYRVSFTADGPPPGLFRDGAAIHAWVGHAAGGDASELVTIGPTVTRRPAFVGDDVALRDPIHEDAQLVALFARGGKRWISVIEGAPDSAARRVRLVEVDASGRATVRATGEVGPAQSRTHLPYEQAGEVAVVPLGASVYGVVVDQPLVLDGPGDDLGRFIQHPDLDCPERKRCYPLPALHDLRALVGVAPDGSFVVADQGVLTRASARGTTSFRYESLPMAGVVGNAHVTLAHLGEPSRVSRWTSPRPRPPSDIPPPPPGRAGPPELPLGERRDLATGGVVALAEDGEGAVFAIGDDGMLRQLDGGNPRTIFTPPQGARTTAVIATPARIAFVVTAREPGRAPHHVVVTRD